MAFIRPYDPGDFEAKLEREFRGRLRIRWSTKRGEWHIEQRVRRGMLEGQKPSKKGWDESRDEYVRYRDGYVLVMAVTTGDKWACPICGHDMNVPFMQTTHVRCDFCKLQGKSGRQSVVHMPLGDVLMNHLKSIDPENPISEKLAEDLDRQNEALARTMETDAIRPTEAAFEERYNRIVGIPQFGYSGASKMWLPKETA